MQVPLNEAKESYWSGVVATVLNKAVRPFLGIFSFMNSALNWDRNFSLSLNADKDHTNKHLTDFIGMNQRYSGNNFLLQYQDTRNSEVQSFVKVAASTNDKSFKSSCSWVDTLIEVNSGLATDPSSSVR